MYFEYFNLSIALFMIFQLNMYKYYNIYVIYVAFIKSFIRILVVCWKIEIIHSENKYDLGQLLGRLKRIYGLGSRES